MSDQQTDRTPHERKDKNLLAEAATSGLSTFVATVLIVYGLSALGAIPKEPFGQHIIVVSAVAGVFVLVFITTAAVLIATVMVHYFRWRYGHRYILVEDDAHE